ncbi:hypothetical protein E3N88_25423 [Mikania micrantha]|uniref:Uncharacterized protein n=1 Tax=Mikania micrantha TaxID=192012 RepID=A0A5N6N4P3_9ASTR|nr:hypothetical protein E3N88_25423 [Mikania micrantha]
MHHLRDVLRKEGILYALDNPITPKQPIGCTTSERMKDIGHECEIKYLILTSVSPEFVDQLMYLSSHEMIEEIKKSFLPNRFWRFEIFKEVQKGLRPGGDVRAHVDRLQGYFDRLGKLGYPMNLEVAIDFILISLPEEYVSHPEKSRPERGASETNQDRSLRSHNDARPTCLVSYVHPLTWIKQFSRIRVAEVKSLSYQSNIVIISCGSISLISFGNLKSSSTEAV